MAPAQQGAFLSYTPVTHFSLPLHLSLPFFLQKAFSLSPVFDTTPSKSSLYLTFTSQLYYYYYYYYFT